MPRRFVDLSITLCNEVVSDPPFLRPEITYQTHHETMDELGHFFPGVAAGQTPGGQGFAAVEWVKLSTQNGTHLDAPWHFHPTQNGGRPSKTIEANQLRLIKQRGADMTIFSPRASTIAPHVGDQSVAVQWAQVRAQYRTMGPVWRIECLSTLTLELPASSWSMAIQSDSAHALE